MPGLIILSSSKTKVPLRCLCGESRVILERSHDLNYFAVWRCRGCGQVRKHVSKASQLAEVAR